MKLIIDQYGRTFSTLRVSLLNQCNLGCIYCVSSEEEAKSHKVSNKSEALPVSVLLGIIEKLHSHLGLETIRLTGGEPTLYHHLTELITGIKSLGIPKIKLTTNGFLLERLAAPMKTAGMQGINVSLDAIDEDIFFQMSRRRSAERVIKGIDAALQVGLAVKMNTVVMKGVNDSQILPLLEFAFSRNVRIRFLEVMAMGHLHDQADRYFLSQKDILAVISSRYELLPEDRSVAATARYWTTKSGHAVGIIANESEPFCSDCNRLRLDSSGNIYGCLSSNFPIRLDLAESDKTWDNKLQQALSQKQALRFTGSELSMLQIGG